MMKTYITSSRSSAPRRRRGMTLIEMMIAALIMLWILATLAAFARLNSTIWQRGMLDNNSQGDAQQAIQSMAPDIRAARSVVGALSDASQVTLQLPLYDANGDLIIPLQDGDVVSYYLSNTTGTPGLTGGTILWKSVNGVPDSAWSLTNGQGRIVVSPAGLTLSYYPTADPETVTISITTSSSSGSTVRSFVTSQEVMLRNKGL